MIAYRWTTVTQVPSRWDCFWTLKSHGDMPSLTIRLPTFQLSTQHTRKGDRVLVESVSDVGSWRVLKAVRPVHYWRRRG